MTKTASLLIRLLICVNFFYYKLSNENGIVFWTQPITYKIYFSCLENPDGFQAV